MSGVPLPTSEIPAGTLTVRVVRGALSNLVVGQIVEVTGELSRTGTTNDAGRAEFTGLTPGAKIRAVAVVDGQRLESQEFALPAQSGVRVMLVATDPAAAQRAEEDRRLAAGPPRPGIVVLGEQSRYVIELGADGLTVYNIFQVVNTLRGPVEPPVPITFVLPEGAQRASMLEGSSPAATVAGDRVHVKGPFPPGMTLVQFAYTVPYSRDTVTITQRLPAALTQLAVVVQKTADMRLSSPQIAQQRDMSAEGQNFILGQGPPQPAGTDITLTLTGVPHPPGWPKALALTLAAVVLTGGAIGALRGRQRTGGERARLEADRERLFAELTALEASHHDGPLAAAQAARRREIVAALERIYAALDDSVAA